MPRITSNLKITPQNEGKYEYSRLNCSFIKTSLKDFEWKSLKVGSYGVTIASGVYYI